MTCSASIRSGCGWPWPAEGDAVGDLTAILESLPEVELVTRFGRALHVSGSDRGRLMEVLAPWSRRSDMQLTMGPPALEDVFIHLMQRAEDNYVTP